MIALTAITHRDKTIRARTRAKEMIDRRADTYFKPFSQPNRWPPVEHGIIFFSSLEEMIDYILREEAEDSNSNNK